MEVPLEHRKCSTCQKVLPFSDFYKRKRGGFYSECRTCQKERHRTYGKNYRKNRPKAPKVNNSSLIVNANPELLKYWDFSKNKSIKEVTTGSNVDVYWKCYKCAHSWKSSPTIVSSRNYICEQCFKAENSFGESNPELIPLWSLENKETPFQVPVYSARVLLWQCPCGNEYKSRVEKVLASRYRTCPDCVTKLITSSKEKDLADFVSSLCGEDNIVFNDRKILSGQELDIYIPSKKIAIEYNGLYWHSEKFKEKQYHYSKWKTCKEKGIELISIWEDDWEIKESAVKHMLEKKLGFLDKKEYLNSSIDIREISRKEKTHFTEKYNIERVPLFSHDFGIFDDDELLAAFSLSLLSKKTILNFTGYAEKYDMTFYSSEIMNFVKDYAHRENVKGISVVVDNSFCDMKKFLDKDFNVVTYLSPTFDYIIKKRRVSRTSKEFRKREKDDNPLKIYNCGTTKYSYFL